MQRGKNMQREGKRNKNDLLLVCLLGEKDIYEISVDFYKQDTPYVIKCDMMSGEVGRVKPIYFLVFADCTEINQENFKERSIILEKQDWSDWKYT